MATFFFGILCSLGLLGYMFFSSAEVQLVHIESILIVNGGLLAAALLSFSTKRWAGFFNGITLCFYNLKKAQNIRLKFILELGTVFFRGGAKKVEDNMEENKTSDPLLAFVQQGLCSNYTYEDFNIMMREGVANKAEQLEEAVKTLKQLAQYSPGFGMLGTIYGLIKMLHGMADGGMEYLGQGMAIALLTTFYGVILSQLIFQPLATLLEEKSAREVGMQDKIRQVALWVHRKTHPEDLKERIEALLD